MDRLKNFYIKRVIILVIILPVILISWFAWNKYKINQIDNFEKCKSAGYPVQESYPERCVLPSGKSFIQQIPDEGVACTMEAKICPNGSAVGRSGTNCEFEACPTQ